MELWSCLFYLVGFSFSGAEAGKAGNFQETASEKKEDPRSTLTCSVTPHTVRATRRETHPQETWASWCWQGWQLGMSHLFPSPAPASFLSGKEKVCALRFQTHHTKNSHFPDRCLVLGLSRRLPGASCWSVSLGNHSVIHKGQDSYSWTQGEAEGAHDFSPIPQ